MNWGNTSVPSTKNALSSSIGLGSDSQPVAITLLGQETYLADSMEYGLGYSPRIKHGLEGRYYINTAVRGEMLMLCTWTNLTM